MESRTVLFALHETKGVGWGTIRKIVNALPRLKDLLEMEPEDMAPWGIAHEQAILIRGTLAESRWMGRWEEYEKRNIGILTVFDPEYPPLLKETYQPPWILYFKGRLELLHHPLLAVVGTRQPTSYGRRVAKELASALSAYGLGIVSGLAKGIDSEAHMGALSGEGGTVAVLGTGMERVYPPENQELFERISNEGLILTEYPLNTPFHRGLFPKRNRIIAGLTLGTIVIEAAQKSGSLITADLALAESRDVFAVPGPITSPKSQGTLELIKQGAKMVTGPEDILEEYRHMLTLKPQLQGEKTRRSMDGEELNHDEKRLFEILSGASHPLTIDELMEITDFDFGHLHSVLLSLLMKNRIEQLPGSSYTILGGP